MAGFQGYPSNGTALQIAILSLANYTFTNSFTVAPTKHMQYVYNSSANLIAVTVTKNAKRLKL